MNFPDNLLYTATHEWVRLEGDTATVGLTDYAQSELGDIVFVELPDVGKKVEAGKPFGSIEAVKTVSDIYAPFTGEITAVNDQIKDNPQIVNSDCYGEGWFVKIKVSDMSGKNNLKSAADYKALTAH